MAPRLSEDEIDDLIYLARAGEKYELSELLEQLAEREGVTTAAVLAAARDEGKSTCLHMATANGHIDVVKTLLAQFYGLPTTERAAFVDAANEYGNTALHWAAQGGHEGAVWVLVAEGGAARAPANGQGHTPLDLAFLHGVDAEGVKVLLPPGAPDDSLEADLQGGDDGDNQPGSGGQEGNQEGSGQ